MASKWTITNEAARIPSVYVQAIHQCAQMFLSLFIGECWGLVTRHWTLVVQLARTRVNDSLDLCNKGEASKKMKFETITIDQQDAVC